MSAPRIVLGPQRPDPNVPDVVGGLPGRGPVVLISAGWRYDEAETAGVMERLGIPVVHLPLYAWFDEIKATAPALTAAYRARQERILAWKKLYQTRLRHLMKAVLALQAQPDVDEKLRRAAIDDAVSDVRRLDDQLLSMTASIHHQFPEAGRTWEHPVVRARVGEIEAALMGSRAVLVAGGHVGVLRNRLQFFGLDHSLPAAHAAGSAIVAWSAGAMALSERVVLFYDDPPEGSAFPEVFDRGIGLLPGAVFLPHARRRLRLEDRGRVSVLAQRFGPEPCLGVELGAHLVLEDGRWHSRGPAGTVLRLGSDGVVAPWEGRHG